VLKRYILRLVNFILYSNLWIAGAAVCMALQTQLLLTGRLRPGAYHGLLLFGTLALYAAHRLIGLKKVMAFTESGRFAIINRLRLTVLAVAIISGLFSAYFLWHIPLRYWPWLTPAALASAAYVLPFLKDRQRLRDVNYVKIFLIALVWSWLTAFMPAFMNETTTLLQLWAIGLERFFFVFAITLPFDIRDMKIDLKTSVKTLPSTLGIQGTQRLAGLAMILMLACVSWSYGAGFYDPYALIGLMLSALSSFFLIYYFRPERPDYYYTGLMDGTMIFQFLIVWFLSFRLH